MVPENCGWVSWRRMMGRQISQKDATGRAGNVLCAWRAIRRDCSALRSKYRPGGSAHCTWCTTQRNSRTANGRVGCCGWIDARVHFGLATVSQHFKKCWGCWRERLHVHVPTRPMERRAPLQGETVPTGSKSPCKRPSTPKPLSLHRQLLQPPYVAIPALCTTTAGSRLPAPANVPTREPAPTATPRPIDSSTARSHRRWP